MPTIPIESLEVGKITDADYYSADGRLLIGKGETIRQEHLELMRRRNIWEIYYYTTDEESSDIIETKQEDRLNVVDKSDKILIESDRLNSQWGIKKGKEGFEQLLNEKTFETLDRALKLEKISDIPVGEALKNKMKQKFIDHRPESYKKEISLIYKNAHDSLKNVVHKLINGTKVEQDNIRSIVENFIEPFVDDRNIILSIASQKLDIDDPVYAHMINVSLISMNIGTAMNYSKEQVIQIGIGALLHDIGMLFISPSIRFKQGRLNEEEWYEVRKHPLLGIHILDQTTRLPDTVKYVTYQIHERENGVGYPKQRSGRLIHNFARISQVADIFDAISSPRPYRNAYTPYKGVEMLIKMSKQNLVSEKVVNALLKSVSIFPVGSMVELSDGRIARVISANEYHLARPFVSIIVEKGGVLLSPSDVYTLDLSVETSIQIIKSLPFNSIQCDLFHGF